MNDRLRARFRELVREKYLKNLGPEFTAAHKDNPELGVVDVVYRLNIGKWKESLSDDELCGESIELLVFKCLISAGYTVKQANGLIDRDETKKE